MDKSWWKMMMYSDPSWHFIARASGSKEAQEAADEHEEVLGCIGLATIILVVIGLIVFGAIKIYQWIW